MVEGIVYLLHFDRPYGPAGQQHYISWTSNLVRRLGEHRADVGCRSTARVVSQGIGFVLAQTWLGDRVLERRLKRMNGFQLCPLCAPERRKHWQREL